MDDSRALVTLVPNAEPSELSVVTDILKENKIEYIIVGGYSKGGLIVRADGFEKLSVKIKK